MLVLTRKPGERIVIGDNIVITLVAVRTDDKHGDRIRIGLDAPSDVSIRREEVAEQRPAAQAVAAESSLDSAEHESRQIGQKIAALESQAARERREGGPDTERAGMLSDALLSLRRRCDALLDQLDKMVSRREEP